MWLYDDRSVLVFERKKHQDSMKMLKQQEKLQRQDQVRLEREMRAQQIIEVGRGMCMKHGYCAVRQVSMISMHPGKRYVILHVF